MFLTSQRLMVGQQALSFACSPSFSPVAQFQNWQGSTDACCVPVGTRMQHLGDSGFAMAANVRGSKPGLETMTTTFLTMKNSLKSTGNLAAKQSIAVSSYSTTPLGIEPQADDQTFTEEKIFHKKPAPRLPESPEEENFRHFIKSNLPHPRASQALLQRIRSISQEPLD
jgi:hypothetical protein